MLITLIVVLVVMANFLTSLNLVFGVFILAIMIASMVIGVVITNPLYAVVANLGSTFLLFFTFYRLLGITSIPLGFVLEGLNFLAVLVLVFKRQLKGFTTLFGYLLLLWLLVSFIELFNPFAASRVAWFHAIRQVINNIIPFFVIYSLFMHDRGTIKTLLKFWLFFCLLAALYTFVQEFGGFPPWDYKFVTRSEESISLIYTWGRFRKISFFSGPMENGVILAFNAVLCLGLAFQNNIKPSKKYTLLLLCGLSAWAMIYTGTRTATVMFVAGAAIYIVLSRSKELLVYTCIIAVLLVGYVAKTGGGAALHVMTTAFNPEEDNSMQVRYDNQKVLRGYLSKSPIGFGLGSTGYLGMKYSPNTFLGSFPPDSELVRIVIETGVIGLAIWLVIFYLILSKSLDTLKVKEDDFSDNLNKVIFALLFMFLLGQYPQQILNIGSLKILLGFCMAHVCLMSKSEQ
ncbi:O-antigen ligase family protein [Reichenbachiella agarivorans]|uniref:O-antigen ligase family protein n=1 Tax=Reichenbachiella agarivorans TaxID=2979464 RepID=A0ABY6CPK1_9BACT|nr:O-antigen ligase family protein [Reichenbachiella agarivorans]UXP32436.1 O-antigen ligase family protein [Reichenbachiella agarivorans]